MVVRKKRTVIYFLLAICMLVYAVPQLSIGNGWTVETVFGISWLCMSLLVIAAQLYELFGVDQKTEEELRRIKRYKYWKIQQKIIERTTEEHHQRMKL